jgi:hypothetical protein
MTPGGRSFAALTAITGIVMLALPVGIIASPSRARSTGATSW